MSDVPVSESIKGPSAAPKKVCVVGAGAIGCTLAVRLALAGNQVSVLARGATLAAIRADGISLTHAGGLSVVKVAVSDRAEFGAQDIIFLCVKSPDLANALASIAPMIDDRTIVIPAVNGVPWWYFQGESGRFAGQFVRAVDPDGALAAALPARHLIGSVVFITAEVSSPGVVVSKNHPLIVLGELDNSLSDRLAAVRAMIEATGIEARASDRIRDSLWVKIIANLTSNPLSVVAGATLEQIYGDGSLKSVSGVIMREVLTVAAAYGARVVFDPITFAEQGAAMGPVRTSMLQDYSQGRRLELAAIGDAVLELAQRFDIPMPITRCVLAITHFRDTQTGHQA